MFNRLVEPTLSQHAIAMLMAGPMPAWRADPDPIATDE
jgi:hypothetical protein